MGTYFIAKTLGLPSQLTNSENRMAGNLKLHAGDFSTLSPNHRYSDGWGRGGAFHLAKANAGFSFNDTDVIQASELEILQLASEESVKSIGGAVGWGAVGGLVLGPVGLLAGLLLGGKSKTVSFIAKFKDGRKFIASTDPKTWVKIQGGALHLL